MRQAKATAARHVTLLLVLFASLDNRDELEIVELAAFDRRLFPYLLDLQPTAQFA